MGNRTLAKGAPDTKEYKGLHGISKAIKESRNAGYGDDAKKYFANKKTKENIIRQKNIGNTASLSSRKETLG